jgi:hypothetical protein
VECVEALVGEEGGFNFDLDDVVVEWSW